MDSTLVSVVIPVFNGAEYLQECLESVLSQTHTRWEGVIVNNCSTDRTGEIAEAVCRRDSRFKVIHCKDFVGQAENYNRAIANASPQARYVKVLEADNWLMTQCIERMVGVAEGDRRIGLVGSYYLHGRTLMGAGLSVDTTVIEGSIACRMHLVEKLYFFGTPTSLLFRAEALRAMSPAFNPGFFHDDVDLCFRLACTWKFGFVHQVLAFVRENNQGILSQFSDFGFRLPLLRILCEHYGNSCLNRSERVTVPADIEHRYKLQLGRALLGGRNQAFWDFHRQAFHIMGREFSKRELVWPAFLAFLDLLLNPKSTWERLWERVRKGQSRKHVACKEPDTAESQPRCMIS